MKHILGIILLAFVLNASAGMADENGKVIDKDSIQLGVKLVAASNYGIADITLHCDAKGYFIYGGTIYQCVKIRENVTREELTAYSEAENKRLKARWAEYQKQMQDAREHK